MADFYTPGAELPSPPPGSNVGDMVTALQGLGNAFGQLPIVKGAVQGFTAAHDALNSTPENPYTTDKAISDAHAMSGLMATGAPAAVEGSAGIFGGRLASKHFDPMALNEARNMELYAAPKQDIHSTTGWFRGNDGKWRYEISDDKAIINPKFTDDLTDHAFVPDNTTVGEFLHHPELYKHYPDLAERPLNHEERNGISGSYTPSSDQFTLRGQDIEEVRDSLLHELQHGVQKREGFAGGTSPSAFYPKGFDEANERLRNVGVRWNTFFRNNSISPAGAAFGAHNFYNKLPYEPGQLAALGKLLDTGKFPDFMKYIESKNYAQKNILDPAYNQYNMTPGEIEARNVETRSNFTPSERFDLPPWLTQEDLVKSLLNQQK